MHNNGLLGKGIWGLDSSGDFRSKKRLSAWFLHSSSPNVREIVFAEIERVRMVTEREAEYMHHHLVSKKERQKRLLFLFQCDLLPGISGRILTSKALRESSSHRGRTVSLYAKALGYAAIVITNSCMLFYIFLFALRQTTARQNAWLRSFIVWLVMEILVVGTVVVFVTHFAIPAMIMKDVHVIKNKLLANIRDYHLSVRATGERRSSSATERERKGEKERSLNSAEYLFVSHKIAQRFSDLPIARFVIQFSTPWPRQTYQHVVDVSKKYGQRLAGVSSSLGVILLFFLSSFLSVPVGVQDVAIHSLFTISTGYLVLLHMRLFGIFPALAFIPLAFILVAIHFLLRSSMSRGWKTGAVEKGGGGVEEVHGQKKVKVVPYLPVVPARSGVVPSRRDSLVSGLTVMHRLKDQIESGEDFDINVLWSLHSDDEEEEEEEEEKDSASASEEEDSLWSSEYSIDSEFSPDVDTSDESDGDDLHRSVRRRIQHNPSGSGSFN